MKPNMVDIQKETTPQVPKNRKIPSKRRRMVLLFAFFLLGCICFWLWRFLQKPAVGTIRPGATPLAEQVFTREKEKQRYTGKYLDFSHGAAYREKGHDLPVNGLIKESIFLSAEDIEGRKISLILADRGTSDLASDPSFQVRSDASGEYQSKSFQVANFQGTVFQKNTQIFEVTAFFSYQEYIVSISLTSPFTLEGLETELSAIMESLHFSFD